MSKVINGLTIRMALYLDAFLISTIMGFSMPITTTFFYSVLTPQFIASAAIGFRLMGVITSYIKQSYLMIKWLSNNFIKIVLLVDIIYLLSAIFGAGYPEMRFLIYNITGITAVKLLQAVRTDNIANCLHGTTIVTFKAKTTTIGLIGGIIGSAAAVVILDIIKIDVTVAMVCECLFCSLGHWLQAFANKRVYQLGIMTRSEVSFIEAFNDLIKGKNNKNKEGDDSILDQ